MKKEKVGALLCEENKEGSFLLLLMDIDVQIETAVWNAETTSRIAHFLSTDFIQWLINEANEGNWSKEEVGSILCRKNADNQLILATLDEETRRQVAVFNKVKTCSAVPYLEKESDFLQWLYQEAVEGRWDQSMVFDAVVKETSDGKIKIPHGALYLLVIFGSFWFFLVRFSTIWFFLVTFGFSWFFVIFKTFRFILVLFGSALF